MIYLDGNSLYENWMKYKYKNSNFKWFGLFEFKNNRLELLSHIYNNKNDNKFRFDFYQKYSKRFPNYKKLLSISNIEKLKINDIEFIRIIHLEHTEIIDGDWSNWNFEYNMYLNDYIYLIDPMEKFELKKYIGENQ